MYEPSVGSKTRGVSENRNRQSKPFNTEYSSDNEEAGLY
jgi:hypothetical protein